MARTRKVPVARVELSLTSMMDLVFNLMMFFVLVNNFAAAELPPLETPHPHESKAREIAGANRLVVNVVPKEDDRTRAEHVKVGMEDPIYLWQIGRLSEVLAREVQINKDVMVDLRADRSLHYDQVQPVMAAIAAAGVGQVNVVAQLPD